MNDAENCLTSESERSGSGTDVEEYGEKDDGQANALLKDDNEMDRQRSMSNDFKFKKMLLHFRQVEKKSSENIVIATGSPRTIAYTDITSVGLTPTDPTICAGCPAGWSSEKGASRCNKVPSGSHLKHCS